MATRKRIQKSPVDVAPPVGFHNWIEFDLKQPPRAPFDASKHTPGPWLQERMRLERERVEAEQSH